MKLAYIIAPYTAPNHYETKLNIQHAEHLAAQIWSKGDAVICPHLNTAFFSGLVPEEQFYAGTLLMLSKCDYALISPRYKSSKGSLAEIEFAKVNNIKLVYHITV